MPRLLIVTALIAVLSATTPARAEAPKVPEGVEPLTAAQILELLDGNTFRFVAYDEHLTGTTTWDYDKGVVSGDYVFKEEKKGTFEVPWFLKGDMCCILKRGKEQVCQIIYPYKNGFMEVRPDGIVHAVSVPVQ